MTAEDKMSRALLIVGLAGIAGAIFVGYIFYRIASYVF